MTGPPRKDPSLTRRRRATQGFVQLPAAGRLGPTPPWPLSNPPLLDEELRWAKLWATPQAIEWERGAATLEVVAAYVRVAVAAEQSTGNTQLHAEARQQASNLGLTPKAMLALHWEIANPEEEEDDGDTRPEPRKRPARTYVPKGRQ